MGENKVDWEKLFEESEFRPLDFDGLEELAREGAEGLRNSGKGKTSAAKPE